MTESMRFREFVAGEIRDADDKERSFSHAISDESVDAHGSIIKIDGWQLDRFKANPVVLFGHDSRSLPIGRSRKIWAEGGKLMSRTEFAGAEQGHPMAETAYRLVRDGFIRAWSVGFMPREREARKDLTDDEKKQLWDPYVYTKQELMEYSLVPVPSNPNALLGARDAGHDLEPLTAWLAQNREAVAFYSARGFEMTRPGGDQLLDEVKLCLLEEMLEEMRL